MSNSGLSSTPIPERKWGFALGILFLAVATMVATFIAAAQNVSSRKIDVLIAFTGICLLLSAYFFGLLRVPSNKLAAISTVGVLAAIVLGMMLFRIAVMPQSQTTAERDGSHSPAPIIPPPKTTAPSPPDVSKRVINKAFSIVDTTTAINNSRRTVTMRLTGESQSSIQFSSKAHVFLNSVELPLDLRRSPPIDTLSPKGQNDFMMILGTWPPGGYEAATSGTSNLTVNLTVSYDTTIYTFEGQFDPRSKPLLTLDSHWRLKKK